VSFYIELENDPCLGIQARAHIWIFDIWKKMWTTKESLDILGPI
jgi:hypothetical protein